jgi:hypothetical protein
MTPETFDALCWLGGLVFFALLVYGACSIGNELDEMFRDDGRMW